MSLQSTTSTFTQITSFYSQTTSSNSSFSSHVHDLLLFLFQPNPAQFPAVSKALKKAVIQTSNPHHPNDPTGSIESNLWELWVLILDLARSVPASQETLVKLLETIATCEDGEEVQIGQYYAYKGGWEDLPIFSMQLTEDFNNGDLLSPSSSSNPKLYTNFLSFTRFLARCTASHILRPLANFPWFVLVAFHFAFELPPVSESETIGWLVACLIWLKGSGKVIWEWCETENGIEGGMEGPERIWKWAGWRGFERRRWEGWKVVCSELEEEENEMGGKAKEMREMMEEIESREGGESDVRRKGGGSGRS